MQIKIENMTKKELKTKMAEIIQAHMAWACEKNNGEVTQYNLAESLCQMFNFKEDDK